MNKENGNRISSTLIFAAVFTGVFLLFYLLIGMPVLRYYDSQKNKFKQEQAELAQSYELILSLPDPQKAINGVESKIRELQERETAKKQIPGLLQTLSQAAGEQGVTVVSLRPREDINDEPGILPAGINKVYLEVVLDCDYRSLAEYIKKAGELPAAFKVESLLVEKQRPAVTAPDVKGNSKKQAAAPGSLKATLVLSVISG